jgi:hypothetical protein
MCLPKALTSCICNIQHILSTRAISFVVDFSIQYYIDIWLNNLSIFAISISPSLAVPLVLQMLFASEQVYNSNNSYVYCENPRSSIIETAAMSM